MNGNENILNIWLGLSRNVGLSTRKECGPTHLPFAISRIGKWNVIEHDLRRTDGQTDGAGGRDRLDNKPFALLYVSLNCRISSILHSQSTIASIGNICYMFSYLCLFYFYFVVCLFCIAMRDSFFVRFLFVFCLVIFGLSRPFFVHFSWQCYAAHFITLLWVAKNHSNRLNFSTIIILWYEWSVNKLNKYRWMRAHNHNFSSFHWYDEQCSSFSINYAIYLNKWLSNSHDADTHLLHSTRITKTYFMLSLLLFQHRARSTFLSILFDRNEEKSHFFPPSLLSSASSIDGAYQR